LSAYSLGSIEVLGDREVVHRPWFIAPGEETDLFAAFLRWQRDPPKDQRQADEATAAAFRLCRANPAFLLHQFGRIKLGNSGAGPFNQWTPGQRRLHLVTQRMRAAQQPVRIICLKARRQGVSTWAQGMKLWRTGFHPYANGLTAAHEDKAAETLHGIYTFMLEGLPDGLRPSTSPKDGGRRTDSQLRMRFAPPFGGETNYRTVAPGGGTKDKAGKGRSGAVHFGHWSEGAFWDEPKNFWTGAIQCVEEYPETYSIMESTANSYGWFHDMWKQAAAGWRLSFDRNAGRLRWRCEDPRASMSDMVPVFLSWLEEPKYRIPFDTASEHLAFERSYDPDEKTLAEDLGATAEQLQWRRRTLHGSKFNGNLADFNQEYPGTPDDAFKSSGRKVFDMQCLSIASRRIDAAQTRPTRFDAYVGPLGQAEILPNDAGPLTVWKRPDPTREYVIGVDGSYGRTEGDWMVAQVLDMHSWEQVACIRMRETEQEIFAEVIAATGVWYREALVVVEVNGPGLAVQKAMERDPLSYGNFYARTVPDSASGRPTNAYGWWTSDKSRRWMVAELVKAVRGIPQGEGVGINDPETVAEMRGWIYKRAPSGKVKEAPASPKGFDDRITALGIALTGGCIEAGVGAPIVSAKVGDKDRHRRTIDFDPKAAELLKGPDPKAEAFFHPTLGANV